MRRLWAGAVLLVVVVTGCGGGSSVAWDNYSGGLQDRIDRKADAGDCAGLQDEFDVADENDGAQRENFGTGNADLMAYIDEKLEDAGCYG